MTAPMPIVDELGPNDVFVQVHTEPDGQDRVQFTAFWRDDYLPPAGVRGEVFHTSLEKFTARCEKAGEKVRHWNPKDGVL